MSYPGSPIDTPDAWIERQDEDYDPDREDSVFPDDTEPTYQERCQQDPAFRRREVELMASECGHPIPREVV